MTRGKAGGISGPDDLDRKRNDNFMGYVVRKVEIVDPYIRQFYQRRNLKEPLEVIPSHFELLILRGGCPPADLARRVS
ncbi:hypothetical protein [Olsenella sp. Marseille-P4559]|uniref:hypothetical protein n=1 Tax=Olsenella sp. Marseille-P4559 TaxID=2364795 RepID=UPI00103279D2|nr:hypothetical protein [Olsenella sp. Marseille-P4559]